MAELAERDLAGIQAQSDHAIATALGWDFDEIPAPEEQCDIRCSYFGEEAERPITREECRLAKSRANQMGIKDLTCGFAARRAIEMSEICMRGESVEDTATIMEGAA